jgi:hypothetical protein
MALYQLKNPETVEAFPDVDGNYLIVKAGVIQLPSIKKADFEAKYAPFVKG